MPSWAACGSWAAPCFRALNGFPGDSIGSSTQCHPTYLELKGVRVTARDPAADLNAEGLQCSGLEAAKKKALEERFCFVLSSPKDIFFSFRERGREGGRERETEAETEGKKHWCERETSIGRLLICTLTRDQTCDLLICGTTV